MTSNKAVERHHQLTIKGNICAGSINLMAGQAVAHRKPMQCRLTAIDTHSIGEGPVCCEVDPSLRR